VNKAAANTNAAEIAFVGDAALANRAICASPVVASPMTLIIAS
jgi:hypothetical protein